MLAPAQVVNLFPSWLFGPYLCVAVCVNPKVGRPEEGHLPVHSQKGLLKDRKFALAVAFLPRPQTSLGVSEQAWHPRPSRFPSRCPTKTPCWPRCF